MKQEPIDRAFVGVVVNMLTLTPEQQQQIVDILADVARWRNEDKVKGHDPTPIATNA